MTTVFEVLHKKAEPYKVTLTRGQKGTYGWEITMSGSQIYDIIGVLKLADAEMQKQFGGGDAQ